MLLLRFSTEAPEGGCALHAVYRRLYACAYDQLLRKLSILHTRFLQMMEGSKIKEWSKVMNAHTELIRDNMNVRKPQVGDRCISILHYGDGPVYLFYGILPRREE